MSSAKLTGLPMIDRQDSSQAKNGLADGLLKIGSADIHPQPGSENLKELQDLQD